MKRAVRLTLTVAFASLSACETTGDPQRGGLFGWSETLARQRQAQKQAEVAKAKAELARESSRTDALRQRRMAAESAAETKRRLAEDRLHAQSAELLAKTEHFDEDCPTAATASRARAIARKLRLQVNTVAADPSRTIEQRVVRLRQLEAEIDAAKAELAK